MDRILLQNLKKILEFGNPKNNLMRVMVNDLKTQLNTPIDGVGLQSHFKLENMNSSFIENLGKQKLIDQASLSSMKLPRSVKGGATMKGFRIFVKIKNI